MGRGKGLQARGRIPWRLCEKQDGRGLRLPLPPRLACCIFCKGPRQECTPAAVFLVSRGASLVHVLYVSCGGAVVTLNAFGFHRNIFVEELVLCEWSMRSSVGGVEELFGREDGCVLCACVVSVRRCVVYVVSCSCFFLRTLVCEMPCLPFPM